MKKMLPYWLENWFMTLVMYAWCRAEHSYLCCDRGHIAPLFLSQLDCIMFVVVVVVITWLETMTNTFE